MKIAMIGHKRIPGREGGIEVAVEELATRMVKMGHDVTCYNRKKKNYVPLHEYKGIKIKTIFTIERKNTDAIIYSFIASINVLFHKFDVIHYHGIGPSIMLIIPHLFGKKTIVTVHGLNYKTPKWKGLGAKAMLLGEKITAKYADEIIVLSKEQKQYLKEKYNRESIFIPNGVTISPILKPNIIKEKWNLEKNSYILFLSRVVPGKGLEYLIEAYKKIDTKINLVIAGGTEYVDDFYNKICDDIKDDPRIKMIGFVTGNTIGELYSNARLFVFPSEAEGMAICLLEALSYNTPCLVSDIPENKEVGLNYVNYFKSKDSKDLRQKLEKILQNPKDENIKSSNFVEEQYSWDKIVSETLAIYGGEK